MKKWKQVLLSCAAACTVLSVSAAAASFESTADALKNMGLFAGTSTGYELDRAPTRAEAAAMLVRLLGKTAEAESEWEATKSTFAFQDMDDFDWAQPSVHWLSKNGLAAGTSANRFTPSAPCTAQMYAAFLMRALGYSEAAGDYVFDNVLPFARQKGVINAVNCDETQFLRDHVVAMSYTALATAPKTGEADLLTRLVNSGAIPSASASMVQQKFSDYRGYQSAMQPALTGIALDNVSSLSISGGISLEAAAVSKTRLSGSQLSTESSLTLTVPGTSPTVLERSGYYTGGRWYVSENGKKSWQNADLNSLMQELTQSEAVPLVLLDEIRTSSTEYILTYSAAGKSHYLASLQALMKSLGGSVSFENLAILSLNAAITVENGQLSAISSEASVSGRMSGPSVNGSTDVIVHAQQNSRVSAVGRDVSVEVPGDLASYTQSS